MSDIEYLQRIKWKLKMNKSKNQKEKTLVSMQIFFRPQIRESILSRGVCAGLIFDTS